MNFYSLWSNDLPWYPMLLRFLELFDQISCIYQVIPPLIVNTSITCICLQSLYDHLLVNIKHCWDTYHHRYLDSLFCNKYWGCRMFVINVCTKRKHFNMNTNPFIVDESTSFTLLILCYIDIPFHIISTNSSVQSEHLFNFE